MRGCDLVYHRRIREKYEAELKEVERSERNTLEKFNSMKVGVYTDSSTHVLCASLSLFHVMSLSWRTRRKIQQLPCWL